MWSSSTASARSQARREYHAPCPMPAACPAHARVARERLPPFMAGAARVPRVVGGAQGATQERGRGARTQGGGGAPALLG
eukprot:918174-Prymnesium_polylepis.2